MIKLQQTSLIFGISLLLLSACGGGGTTAPTGTNDTQTDPKPDPTVKPKSNYSLFLQQGLVSIKNSPDTNFGAKELDVWGFSDVESKPANNVIVPGVTIDAEVNKVVTVSVKNNLLTAHKFSFVRPNAVDMVASSINAIAVGATTTYTITPKTEGIYIYSDPMNNGVNQSMGLYGVMIVRPATSLGNVVWTGGPTFTKEVTWVIADLDYKNYNTVVINSAASFNSTTIDTTKYKANYFLMNGMNGFQAMEDPNTIIEGTVDETVLVRIANAGQYSQSLHFHGNHFQVISRNGVRLTEFESQDTINVKPNETAMVLYTIDQVGHYPMHVHTAQMETGAGVYLNGTAAMIIGK